MRVYDNGIYRDETAEEQALRESVVGDNIVTIEDRIAALEKQQTLDIVTKTVSLPTSNWTGDTSPYSQIIDIEGVTTKSKIDLQPSVEQLTLLQSEEISLLAINNDGVVTVYAVNAIPSVDLEMQVLITEVTVV